jgi:hypothetical protein
VVREVLEGDHETDHETDHEAAVLDRLADDG